MPIYKSNEKVALAFKGSEKLTKIYKGNDLVYTLGYILEKTGYPIYLLNCIAGLLIDYKIYGNSVQSGTPSPTNPVEIDSVGDPTNNLLDPSGVANVNQYIMAGTGGTNAPSASTIWRASDYIEIEPDTTYYFKEVPTTATSAGSAWYDSNKTYISGFNATTLGNNNNFATSPNNAKYLRHSFLISPGYNPDWQNTVSIVKSDVVVPYEPFGKYKITFGTSSKIPMDYQEVEYISSSGTQYIDTGLEGKNGYTMEAKISFNSYYSSYNYFAGFGTASNNRIYFTRCARTTGSGTDGWTFNGDSHNLTTTIVNLNTIYTYKSIMETGNQKLYRNGVLLDSATNNNSNTYSTIWLFAADYNGSMNGACDCKMYECRFYYGGNLVGEYVPCYRKSDGVIGVYDSVTNRFLTNSGSGTFTKGANVPSTDTLYSVFLDEPLRKIGDVVDYIDYGNSKIVRNIASKKLQVGGYAMSTATTYTNTVLFPLTNVLTNGKYGTVNKMCNRFITSAENPSDYEHIQGLNISATSSWLYVYMNKTNIPDYDPSMTDTQLRNAFNNFVTNNETIVNYELATPVETTITLPDVNLSQGDWVLSTTTAVKPSSIYVKYRASSQ